MRVSMKKIAIALTCAAWLAGTHAGTKATGNWSAPELQPGTYRKVLVLAKVSEDVAKHVLEDTMVKGLADKGIAAVPAYQVLTPADLASADTIRSKAHELGVDAGFVFTVTGEQTQVQSGPTFHASVGVPVSAGPFSVFLGTSVPLGGGSSTVRKIGVKAEFYAAEAAKPLWMGTYATDLKAGVEGEAQQLANLTLKQTKKAGIWKKP